MIRWYFGLDAGIIQDGHHQDFFRGQQAEFAVEFDLAGWEPSPDGSPSAQRVGDCDYDVVARVAAVAGEGWVLDCGLLAHSGAQAPPPPEIAQGDSVAARARLGVSTVAHPQARFGVEGLRRLWFVERVHHKVDPAETVIEPSLLVGDPQEIGWEELAFTSAWQDDDGRATYLLECVPSEATIW